MRRLAVPLVLAALLLVAPVAGHAINVAELDAQATPDGTVYVEAVFLESPGWVALYADGEPVGHAPVETAAMTVNDVAVTVDADVLDAGPVRLEPRLFADDGDGAFDPDADSRLMLFDDTSGVPVASGDTAYVLAEDDGSGLRATDGTVRVRRAALPADGHLVAIGADGNVLGSRALEAGTHENVTVPVADEAFADDDGVTVAVTVYRDDGDGAFDDADEPVRVGNETVSTTVDIRPKDESGGNGTTTSATGVTDGEGPGFAPGAALLALVALAGLAGLRETELL